MKKNKDNNAYLKQIRDHITEIVKYTESHSYDDFEDNQWDQHALIHHLQIIGEAANRVEESFQNKHPEIPWRDIVSIRNIIVHDYDDVDVKTIWDTAIVDLPQFLSQINNLLQ